MPSDGKDPTAHHHPSRRWRPGAAWPRRFALCATAAVGLAGVSGFAVPESVSAQAGWDPTCGAAEASACGRAEALGRAALAGVGLAQAGPGTLVGSASTLGRRFGTTPRVALSVRGGVTRFPWPDFAATEAGTRNASVGSLHGSVVVGLFDGFSPQPTVGGLLGLDLLLTGDWVFLPEGDGFDGSGAAWGYGVRLGVIRESFSLPGITLSGTRRHGGDIDLLPPSVGSGVSLQDPVTTSLRGEIGKEFWGVGFLVGAGWDRYEADAVVLPGPGTSSGPGPLWDGLDADRALFFAGLSRTFVVWQLSAEFGWAEGVGGSYPSVPGYDSAEGSLFGTVQLRLTL